MLLRLARRVMGQGKIGNLRRSRANRKGHGPVVFERLEDRTLMSLLGIAPGHPLIEYNNTGVMSYDAASQQFSVDANPISFKATASSPLRSITSVIGIGEEVKINIIVDNTGALVGGVPGDDFVITGEVNLDGVGGVDASGTLLTGEILGFGFQDTNLATDNYDFRFVPTGGLLLSYFAGKDIGVVLTSESSNFAGSFASNFAGEAKGRAGAIAAFGDFVWEDLDGDGTQDGDEPGVEGVRATLNRAGPDGLFGTADDPAPLVTFTDSTGLYRFDNLSAGNYTVTFDQLPAGHVFTTPDQGVDDAFDSDADQTTGTTPVVTLASGEVNLTLDAGLVQPASIGDFVWEDLNGDGDQDTGEPGIAGVPVDLLDTANNVLASTTTDANGFYLFGGLQPGDYQVDFGQPLGYTFTTPNQGNDALDSDADVDGVTGIYPLASGETNLTVDAGLFRPASLGDFLWEDLDADGIQDAGEPGIDGEPVVLLDGDGIPLAFDVTEGGGFYLFDNLAPGTYSVQFTPPGGFAFSPKDQGTIADDDIDSDADTVTGETGQYTLVSGEENLTVDAGVFCTAQLGDFVWEDLDRDGVQDAGEPGVAGVIVDLLDGSNTVVGTQTTAADGLYFFGGLTPGGYRVKFTPPTPLTFTDKDQGTDDELDSDADTTSGIVDLFSLISGQTNLTIDAGLLRPVTEPVVGIDIEKYVRPHDCEPSGGGEGLTPGYWKQPHHFDDWTNYSPGDNYNTVFGVNDDPTLTLVGALSRGGGENAALGRHAVAALLNAAHPGVDYAFAEAGIIAAVQSAYATGEFEPLKDQFAAQNEMGASFSVGGGGGADCVPVFDPDNLGQDADGPTGPMVDPGQVLLFSYVVTNTGETELANVAVVDNQVTPTPVLDGEFNVGDVDQDNRLDVNETWYYTATDTADTAGQNQNVGTAAGTPVDSAGNPVGNSVTDSDAAHWFVATPPPTPSSLSGFVYVDADNDGLIDLTELAIVGATVELFDSANNSLGTTTTNTDGQYFFFNLPAGTYTIVETQPDGYLDGTDTIGSLGGTAGNDVFSNISLVAGADGVNYNFGEQIDQNVGTPVSAGQAATIGFWHNKNGQALLKSLNGGQNATNLSHWLATNFPKLYGAQAGSNNLTGKTNAQVAAMFTTLFKVKGQKLDAQVLAVAFGVYVTNSSLAGNVAGNYGFTVDTQGLGAATYNVGSNGAAFGVADGTTLTVMEILLKTNDRAVNGVLWNGNTALRNMANTIFSGINESGDI